MCVFVHSLGYPYLQRRLFIIRIIEVVEGANWLALKDCKAGQIYSCSPASLGLPPWWTWTSYVSNSSWEKVRKRLLRTSATHVCVPSGARVPNRGNEKMYLWR